MQNLFEDISLNPDHFRQFSCGDALIARYNCPLEGKFVDLWTRHNYIVCVTEGRKIWHTSNGSFDLKKGSCVFVRKGACVVEQFFDAPFCLYIFFITDEFICDSLKATSIPSGKLNEKKYSTIVSINKTATLEAFFHSMSFYFDSSKEPEPALLELKFRELVLTIADNPYNAELLSYFCSLLHEPQTVSLQRIMEDNYRYNLKLEEYAELCTRSLSAFKRDFEKTFQSTPGKWLLEKRLQYAMHLLTHTAKNVSEAAFESGFENPSHFSRSFREHFGIPPTAVR